MDRLTHYDVNGVAQITPGYCEATANMQAIQRLAAYEDTGLEPEEIIDRLAKAKVAGVFEAETQKALDKLMEYHKAEAEGRLVVLPCKVGDNEPINGLLRPTARQWRTEVELKRGKIEDDS